MPRRSHLPQGLQGQAFTTLEAEAHGLSRRVLQGRRIVQIFPGVHRFITTPLTFDLAVMAAAKYVRPGSAISHLSNLRWRGLQMRDPFPVHAAVVGQARKEHDLIVMHRYQRRLDIEMVRGIPLLRPERTFVDCGTVLTLHELVQVGDWMLQSGVARLEGLLDFASSSHLDGVQRARKALELIRPGAESPRESVLRVTLTCGGLPEPEINTDIHDARGGFLARGDLVYRARRVIVEYDGWYHERSAEQRQKDIIRRERLEAAGWILIVVTALDMHRPGEVVERVRRALVSRDLAM